MIFLTAATTQIVWAKSGQSVKSQAADSFEEHFVNRYPRPVNVLFTPKSSMIDLISESPCNEFSLSPKSSNDVSSKGEMATMEYQ